MKVVVTITDQRGKALDSFLVESDVASPDSIASEIVELIADSHLCIIETDEEDEEEEDG